MNGLTLPNFVTEIKEQECLSRGSYHKSKENYNAEDHRMKIKNYLVRLQPGNSEMKPNR
jgi:hypothetical protein